MMDRSYLTTKRSQKKKTQIAQKSEVREGSSVLKSTQGSFDQSYAMSPLRKVLRGRQNALALPVAVCFPVLNIQM